MSVAERILEIEAEQCELLSNVKFSDKISYIYNPLQYAHETHSCYVKKYCNSPKIVLFLGMNPGPFGMAQNGVPFGDTTFVNNWLKISGNVYKPAKEHPKREIQGLSCSRSEVSGSRFWSFLEETCIQPERFFRYCYVHNYCPFSMMSSSAKNITPPELKAEEKTTLISICDESLYKIIKHLGIKYIVGIGNFAKTRAEKVVKAYNLSDITVVGIMHPSPINPAANKGWKNIAYQQLESYDLLKYLL